VKASLRSYKNARGNSQGSRILVNANPGILRSDDMPNFSAPFTFLNSWHLQLKLTDCHFSLKCSINAEPARDTFYHLSREFQWNRPLVRDENGRVGGTVLKL